MIAALLIYVLGYKNNILKWSSYYLKWSAVGLVHGRPINVYIINYTMHITSKRQCRGCKRRIGMFLSEGVAFPNPPVPEEAVATHPSIYGTSRGYSGADLSRFRVYFFCPWHLGTRNTFVTVFWVVNCLAMWGWMYRSKWRDFHWVLTIVNRSEHCGRHVRRSSGRRMVWQRGVGGGVSICNVRAIQAIVEIRPLIRKYMGGEMTW